MSEQKLVASLRILSAEPRFVFSIDYLTIGEAADLLGDYDGVLEIAQDGGRTWRELKP